MMHIDRIIVLIYSQMCWLLSFPLEDPHCCLEEAAKDIKVWDVQVVALQGPGLGGDGIHDIHSMTSYHMKTMTSMT